MPRHKRGRPPKKKEITIKSEETRIFAALIVGILGIVSILSLFVEGTSFEFISRILGIAAIPAGILAILLSILLFGYSSKYTSWRTILGFILLTAFIAATAHFIIPTEMALSEAQSGQGGGYVGYGISTFLIETFGRFTSIIILLALALISFSLIAGVTIQQLFTNLFSLLKKTPATSAEPPLHEIDGEEFVGQFSGIAKEADEGTHHNKIVSDFHRMNEEIPPFGTTGSPADSNREDTEGPEELKYPNWKTPPLSLLQISQPVSVDPKLYREKSDIIEKTLKSFGIHAKVTNFSIGPRVVQYALSITIGTKVSKVKALGNDLALALAAPSGSVRIEAPIPGTSFIGIEVPNQKPTFVTLGDLMTSEEMKSFNGRLPLILGKNITGKSIINDLARMPHLLIAGATGSGKSVFVNAFLCSLLMTHSPDYVKLILVDPKMVELPPYNGIPHLLTPVITDIERVIYSLEWLVTEMQKRFRILNKAGVKNLEQYNAKLGYSALPYIILVVDEMADIMLSAGIDVEAKIVRLAQMARAVGIHLVLATQRPSVDVLTGLIKANIPARVGMNVATSVDSRVILDMIGAEHMLGDGDMLFKAPDTGRPFRIQGAFVSNKEIEQVTEFLRDQAKDVKYNASIIEPQPVQPKAGTANGISEDALFADALRVVVHAQKASSSLLQRKLRIGYNRAARLVDELYAAKVVGPQDGSKPRKVLVSDAEAFLSSANKTDNDM